MAVLMLEALIIFLLGHFGLYWAQAQVHHVVGGDRGWEPSSQIESWSSGRVFRVGDNIWFSYSAAQERVVELQSKEEFESCDVSNPIRMYTDGVDKVTLDGEGSRFFASGSRESCKNGLKLHIDVLPNLPSTTTTTPIIATVASTTAGATVEDLAAGPLPSGTVRNRGVPTLLWLVVVALLGFMGF